MKPDNDEDIRWRQRFMNYKKGYVLLEQTIRIDLPSEAERAGLIQFFKMSFELAWKLLKDYLEYEGFMIKSPKAAIKQAFQSELISDGHHWMNALHDRNLTVHTYEESTALQVEKQIREVYFPILTKLFHDFSQKAKG
jgi:nucleotidyltransferase substrate binding protein (TIGR01987 family)